MVSEHNMNCHFEGFIMIISNYCC